MPTKTIYQQDSKKFLSDKHDEHSAVCWNANATYFVNDKIECSGEASVESTLRLQDCTRSINIEFDAFRPEDIENNLDTRLKKIDNLIYELNDFREALRGAYLAAQAHNENLKGDKNEDR